MMLFFYELERKYDGQFQIAFRAIRELIGSEVVPPKRRIGQRPAHSDTAHWLAGTLPDPCVE